MLFVATESGVTCRLWPVPVRVDDRRRDGAFGRWIIFFCLLLLLGESDEEIVMIGELATLRMTIVICCVVEENRAIYSFEKPIRRLS